MKRFMTLLVLVCLIMPATFAGPKQKFKVAWSIYAGWMPWDYAQQSGILKKWADAYDIDIELIRMDYIPSIEAYVAEQVDACVMTNMECLDMPAASGIDSTALVVGDFSNGNDALLVRDDLSIKDLKGHQVSLVELSVSHYLLVRALQKNGMKEKDVQVMNTSDSDIAPVFLADTSQKAVVTWNPMVMQIAQNPGISNIFSSADIPGEVIDLMVVNTKVLNDNPALGEALTGAWYEVMSVMSKRGPSTQKALGIMADSAGCSVVEFKSQLNTTAMFYTPQAALDYTTSADLKEKMNFVREFCFDHGLLGENADSVDVVGIQYPDGSIQGDPNAVTFRFNTKFTQLAADGKLKNP